MGYLRLGETIDATKNIIVTFYVESEVSLTEVAESLAAESSIGTWTDISTMREDIMNRLGARIFYVNQEESVIKIAYPLELFEERNLPQLLSDVAGNVFGMKDIKNLRVRDIDFPESYVRKFDGPAFGLTGIRKFLGISDRPLLGTIIKPKVGLSADEHALVAYEAWLGGVDIVKDDENLSDQDFNPFDERLYKTLKVKEKVEKETGEKKMYVPNITAPVSKMLDRAKLAKSTGCGVVMLDIITVGWSGVQFIRDQNLGLVLHGHRAMHGAFTHGNRHGVAMLPLAKIARLAGIDQLHTGTVVGKMHGAAETVIETNNALKGDWYGIKPTMPIASGGLHPGHIEALVNILGNDIIMNFGGGIHGHPDGTYKGARAARQAIDAVMEGILLPEYAKTHKELDNALLQWGYRKSSDSESKVANTYQFNFT
ncbi:type III ribulose-bisphosphate carboxylase [Candidatus Dojkabacteria bacterium]|nr:type III ribulose-bisphosphate carboxylase [Candidatus Dojkabacteria bacterium]